MQKELNRIEKYILPKIYGHRWENRFKWGELYLGVRGSDCAIEFCRDVIFETNDLFIIKVPFLFKLYIHKKKPDYLNNCCDFYNEQSFQYGFDIVENWRAISYGWGKKSHYWDFPWSWNWQKSEVLDYNFKTVWEETKKSRKLQRKNKQSITGAILEMESKEKIKENVSKRFPYTYTLKAGTIQNRMAKVCVERRTWGMKWFPFIKTVDKTIDIEFNDEVGEKTGSWKGGTIGCSYSMLEGETPEMTLRRMEKERKF